MLPRARLVFPLTAVPPAVDFNSAIVLAVGVVSCEGSFGVGDAVEIVGPEGTAFAKGVAQATPEEIERRPRGLEAVHRDRLVVY